MAALDFLDGSDQATKDGVFLVQAGGQHVPNAVYGTILVAYPLLHDGEMLGGGPVYLSMALSMAYDYEDLENYYNYVIGNLPLYTADELNEIFLTDLTAEKMVELAANYSMNDVAEAHISLEQGSVTDFHNRSFE